MPRPLNLPLASGWMAILALSSALGADWPGFRGPGGSGVSVENDLPVRWGDGDGILWKTELPGPGSSSPIVSGSRVFLTSYSGYGTSRGGSGDLAKLRRHVICVDRAGGKLLWDRPLESTAEEAPFQGIGIPNHGYASSTPVTDGERVYAFFGTAGAVAFDLEGKEAWRVAVAPQPETHNFGSAASPVLYKGVVIIPAGVECEAILALDRGTGKEVWRTPAAGYGAWWGTPLLVDVGERKEILVSVPGEVWGLNPENGKLRWHAETFQERTLCPSVVAANGIAYVIGGREGRSVAVRLGGRGDVTKSHVVWKGTQGSYVPSPVVHGGHLFWVNDRGIAHCVKAESGEKVFQERLEGAGGVYASLVAGDGKLYAVTRRNGTLVLEAGPKLREISRNPIASDESDFNASPAISDGRIFLRSNRFLYCVGKPKA